MTFNNRVTDPVNDKPKHWSARVPEYDIDWSQIPGGTPEEWAKSQELERQERKRVKVSDLIRELKKQPCTDCSEHFHPEAMEFDHLEGTTKLFSIALHPNYPDADVLEELKKCELVCANCHRIRTVKRRQKARYKQLLEEFLP